MNKHRLFRLRPLQTALSVVAICVGLVIFRPGTSAAYQPLIDIMNGRCSSVAICLQSTFVNPSNTNSTTITGNQIAHIYGFRNQNNTAYNVVSGILGERTTANCGSGSYCARYSVRTADGTVLGNDRITFSPSHNSVSYHVPAKGVMNGATYGTVTVNVIDTSLYGQPITIRRSRCSSLGSFSCSQASTSNSTLVIQNPINYNWTVETRMDNDASAGNFNKSKTYKENIKWTHWVGLHAGSASGSPTVQMRVSETSLARSAGLPALRVAENKYPSPGASWNLTPAEAANTTHSNNRRTYTKSFTASDIGRKHCQVAWVYPDSYSSQTWEISDPSNPNWYCVTVYSPWLLKNTSTKTPNVTTVAPGEVVTFTHTSINNEYVVKDDDGNNVPINATVYQYINNGTSTAKPSSGLSSVSAGTASGTGENGTVFNKTLDFTVAQDHVGKTFCQFIRTDKTARNNNNNLDSTPVCYHVPYNWHINLTTTATSSSPSSGSAITNSPNNRKPGDTITFTHRAQQMGPTKTNAQVDFSLSHPTTAAGSVSWTATSTNNNIANFASGRNPDSSAVTVRTETRFITQNDVGTTLCSQVTANPGGGGTFSSAARSSTPACVYIPYDYELTPDTSISASGGDGGNIGYDEPTFFEGKINKFSGPTKSKTIDWQAFTFVISSSNRTVPDAKPRSGYTAGISNSHIQTVYGLTGVSSYTKIGERSNKMNCATHNTTSVFFPSPKRTTGDSEHANDTLVCKTADLVSVVNSLNLGDRLCFAMYIQPSWATPASQDPSNYRSYSKPSCLTVSKSPSLNLRGADSKSGATKFGQTTLPTDAKYQGGFIGKNSANPLRGSWSQYGLLSNGAVTNFGSTGYTLDTNRDRACKLIFANTANGGSNCSNSSDVSNFGKLAVENRTITLPKVAELKTAELSSAANAATALTGTNVNGRIVRNLNGLSGTYYVTQDLIITATALAKNQHLTLVMPTNVGRSIFIAGNITAPDTYADLEEIPSLTIIANNIYVLGYGGTLSGGNFNLNSVPVSNIFGTYIARDRFNTCTSQHRFNPDTWAGAGLALAGIGSSSPHSNGDGICKNQLTVTGAIISKNRPNFTRTFGSGRDDVAVSSEIVTYTPANYLTPYALGHNGNNNDWNISDLKQPPARL